MFDWVLNAPLIPTFEVLTLLVSVRHRINDLNLEIIKFFKTLKTFLTAAEILLGVLGPINLSP